MPTIDVKTAVSAAIEYLRFLQDNISDELQNVRLEEVELSEDRNYWLVTLGYDVPVKHQTALEKIMTSPALSPGSPTYKREYKVFKVNSENSQVEAMNIRVL